MVTGIEVARVTESGSKEVERRGGSQATRVRLRYRRAPGTECRARGAMRGGVLARVQGSEQDQEQDQEQGQEGVAKMVSELKDETMKKGSSLYI